METEINVFSTPEVVSSIITAAVAILMGICGWLTGKSNHAAKKALREESLKNLYEPLDYILSFKRHESYPALLIEINNLVSSNYRYLTPDIQAVIHEILGQGSFDPKDMIKLKRMVASMYNLLRKKLYYPYDKTCIEPKYSEFITSKRSFVLDIITAILGLGSTVLTFISASPYLENLIHTITPNTEIIYWAQIKTPLILLVSVIVLFVLIKKKVFTKS